MSVTVQPVGDALELRAELRGATHVLRLPIDRQDQGEILWFDASLWDEPTGEPLASADLVALLDAVVASPHGGQWVAAHRDGFDVLLRAPGGARFVGTYETCFDAGYVTLLELGFTARVDVALRTPRGLVKATLLRDTAQFVHTTRGSPGKVDDVAWTKIEAALFAADKSAFYRGPRWSFERPAAEVKHAPTG